MHERNATFELRQHWTLEPDVVYLNHGSFGACPREVLEAQTEWRSRLEREPVRFFTREAPVALAKAREALAAFVRAPADDLAFVPNATTAINAVLRSFPLAPGDELIVSDQEYNASRNVLDYVAKERGAVAVTVHVPFPPESPGAVVEAVMRAVTPRTRLALLDHVTSQTALVFPIADLVRELEAREIAVLVDGAHAPGMLDLDIAALGASFYTGNCHKWLCAPKGAAFLHVRDDRRECVRPAVISHGANAPVPSHERFRAEFDWLGTDDPSAALCVPTAIAFMDGLLPGGWREVRERNHALLLRGRRIVAEALGRPRLPAAEWLGSMASLPLPVREAFEAPGGTSALVPDPLHERLFDDYGIEVPVLRCPGHPGPMLRISAQLYNEPRDYERLASALGDLL